MFIADLLSYCLRFFLSRPGARQKLHSFPTRRSSDLGGCARDTSSAFPGPIRARSRGTPPRPALPRSPAPSAPVPAPATAPSRQDRKSTRLNSSHITISYAVFCLKKKTHTSNHYCLIL